MAFAAGSIRRPAIRSSLRGQLGERDQARAVREHHVALSGDTEIPGVGGASAIRTMLSGGIW